MDTAFNRLFVRTVGNREISLSAFIVLLLVILAIATPSFVRPGNLTQIVLNNVTVCILALGEVMVIITKGIDLSVGATMGLTTLAVGQLAVSGWPVWALLLVAVLIGLAAGVLNGVLISLVKLPAIIVTLGTLSIYTGLMYLVTGGNWVTNLPNSFLAIAAWNLFGVIPGPVIVMLVLLGLVTVFLRYSVTGRHLYALGNDVTAARLAGVNESRVIVLPYILAGVLGAIAGVLYLSFSGFSTPNTGSDANLQAIAAAVIGGTNVFGGRGSAIGAILGALLLGIIAESLVFFHLPAIWNDAVEGLIILLAVMADSTLSKTTRARRV